MCKSDQKRTQIRRVEEEESSYSEGDEAELSESEEKSTRSSETNTSSDSFDDSRHQKQRKQPREKVKRKARVARLHEKSRTENRELIGKLTEVKPKSNDTIELKLKLNGRPVNLILDSGSPISIIPRSLREWINPKVSKPVPQNRQFVDLYDNEVAITEVVSVETELNGVTSEMDWWEIKSDVKPILGMDNFGKLNLRVLQGKEDKIGLVRTETEKLMFHQKIDQEFG